MDAFALVPPEWTKSAVHAINFCCPSCKTSAANAQNVWLNRRSPVTVSDAIYTGAGNHRKYQEFYLCECNTPWWGWSNDRPPTELSDKSI